MKKFEQRGGGRGGFGPGRRGFSKPRFGGGDRFDRGPIKMHSAVCAECGEKCEVPFRPTGDKPVYCNNCFGGKRDGADRAPRRDFDRPSFQRNDNSELKSELRNITSKLDQLIYSIEKLSEQKVQVKAEKVVSKKDEAPKKAKKVAAKKVKKN